MKFSVKIITNTTVLITLSLIIISLFSVSGLTHVNLETIHTTAQSEPVPLRAKNSIISVSSATQISPRSVTGTAASIDIPTTGFYNIFIKINSNSASTITISVDSQPAASVTPKTSDAIQFDFVFTWEFTTTGTHSITLSSGSIASVTAEKATTLTSSYSNPLTVTLTNVSIDGWISYLVKKETNYASNLKIDTSIAGSLNVLSFLVNDENFTEQIQTNGKLFLTLSQDQDMLNLTLHLQGQAGGLLGPPFFELTIRQDLNPPYIDDILILSNNNQTFPYVTEGYLIKIILNDDTELNISTLQLSTSTDNQNWITVKPEGNTTSTIKVKKLSQSSPYYVKVVVKDVFGKELNTVKKFIYDAATPTIDTTSTSYSFLEGETTDDLSIFVKVSDDAKLKSVLLTYAEFSSKSNSFSSNKTVEMGVFNETTYQVKISVSKTTTKVQFYIYAEDMIGHNASAGPVVVEMSQFRKSKSSFGFETLLTLSALFIATTAIIRSRIKRNNKNW